MQKNQNETITYIPNFMKSDSKPKKTISSFLLKLYFNHIWNKPQLRIRKKAISQRVQAATQSPSREEQVKNVECTDVKSEKDPIQELQTLRNLINTYFCLENKELRDYCFNNEGNSEYQGAIDHPIRTLTQIISKDIQPYMDELTKEFKDNNVQLTYSFPLNGEYGFVTATNIVKEKTR